MPIRLILWLLAAVLVVAATIGLFFLTRGTAVHRVRTVGANGAPVVSSEPAFPLTVALLTGTPIVAGNRVTLALNGDGTFPRLWTDLRAAQRSITIQMYYAEPGRVADTLAAILEARARAGVSVLALFDAFGSGLWTGGFGIDDKWLGGGRRLGEWRETNVRFEGPAVRQLQAAFVAGWAEATGELLTGRVTIDTYEGGVAQAGLLYTAPTLGSTPAERYLALSIAGARERLYITNAYFAPDENFVALLTRAARNGADVRILVGGPSTDVRTARLAAHARYEALLEAGVRVYEYLPTTLHAKTFVVDGLWVSIGTMNFDNRSLSLNDESTLMVLDSAAGRRMDDVFLEDLGHAREIELAVFRRRPWYQRMAEWAANLVTPLL